VCDIEWETPVGELEASGGIAMMRIEAFSAIGGFRSDLIAGEEPELCVRLRVAGWKIWRLDAEMALHDAAMTRFSQWWTRTLRGGYAFAQNATLLRDCPGMYGLRESVSAWFWGLGVPLAVVISNYLVGPLALLLLLIYPLQILRIASRGTRSFRENMWRAALLVVGKFPEMVGQTRFFGRRFLRKPSQLIEYK
jgi:GT2 family glycosyltransferase